MNFDSFKTNCPMYIPEDDRVLAFDCRIHGATGRCTEDECIAWYSMLFAMEVISHNITQGALKPPAPEWHDPNPKAKHPSMEPIDDLP